MTVKSFAKRFLLFLYIKGRTKEAPFMAVEKRVLSQPRSIGSEADAGIAAENHILSKNGNLSKGKESSFNEC
jgi:hypothetical protein